MREKAIKVTAQLYEQFLVSSQVDCTGTYLADHQNGLTHDNMRYFFETSYFTPHQLWQQVRPRVVFSARGYVLFDDIVLDKHHSRRIDLVRRQYSGNTKLKHVADMLAQLASRGIAYRTVLIDSWYATKALFKWLLAAGKTFYYPLKSNCLVDDSDDQQPCQPVGCLGWSNEKVNQGKAL